MIYKHDLWNLPTKIVLFFYEQSNNKVGASENNLQIKINENGKNYLIIIILKTILKNMIHFQIKNFCSLEKITKNKLNFDNKNKIIYTLSIFGF